MDLQNLRDPNLHIGDSQSYLGGLIGATYQIPIKKISIFCLVVGILGIGWKGGI